MLCGPVVRDDLADMSTVEGTIGELVEVVPSLVALIDIDGVPRNYNKKIARPGEAKLRGDACVSGEGPKGAQLVPGEEKARGHLVDVTSVLLKQSSEPLESDRPQMGHVSDSRAGM